MTVPKPHWYRFSLRAMLMLVASLAMILGYSFSRFAAERDAVESILSRGGTVVYFDKTYGKVRPERTLKAWFREFAGLRWPGEAYLKGEAITDTVLRDEVLPLRTLTSVALSDVSVTKEGLTQLNALKSLASVTWLRNSRNEKILRELDSTSVVEMQFTPLKEAMEYFADLHDIKIRIDNLVIQSSTSPLITCKINNRTLSVILDQILAPMDLGWIVANGTLLITTAKTMQAHRDEADAVKASLPQVKTVIIDSSP